MGGKSAVLVNFGLHHFGYSMLTGKKILLGITGSIAAYKSVTLVRLLLKQGAQVKVVMTPAARDFVSPLVLSTLSKEAVLTDISSEDDTWANHVQLGRWADVMLIAPLSCNTLAKMAHGHCDNLLLAVYLSAICPVIFCPAMDEDMWHHPATKKNIALLLSYGNVILQPRHGELASGLIGEGRMEEPETILQYLEGFFAANDDLRGKTVLITAGPTHEALDPVRFIGNHSSGKMGIALAKECRDRGANVVLVLGPVQVPTDLSGITIIKVTTADEMYAVCHEHFAQTDIAIMSAAVADYKPMEAAVQKIKKTEADLQIRFIKNKDILKSLGDIKRQNQVLVGFALETNNEKEYALQKLHSKNADLIVMNSLNDGPAFGADENKVTIFSRNGEAVSYSQKTKTAVASDIVDAIVGLIKKTDGLSI
ncbi:MAG: bifunctional phosphopantothenoylcysteine decarboxylase/phosphopantothenate--cysteine ligase CoaBC [Niabella sp.]